MRQADAILARLKNEGRAKVGSTGELVDWLLAEEWRVKAFIERDLESIAKQTGAPAKLLSAIARDKSFTAALFDELLLRHFNPLTLNQIFQTILKQLGEDSVPLGAKRSMLEFVMRQMGLEKPRKLSVKQQSEIVVRVEPVEPTQVMEVLGVSVEQAEDAEAPALPKGTPEPGVLTVDFTELGEPAS